MVWLLAVLCSDAACCYRPDYHCRYHNCDSNSSNGNSESGNHLRRHHHYHHLQQQQQKEPNDGCSCVQ